MNVQMKHITIYSRVMNFTDDDSSSESVEEGSFELGEGQAATVKNPGVTPILDTFNTDCSPRPRYRFTISHNLVVTGCFSLPDSPSTLINRFRVYS